MGSVDKKFRVNFSEDGAALLRDRVSEKLKEFMGDYTDDVLVVRIYMDNNLRRFCVFEFLNFVF
jgi:hypothetical protein